jgi:hypothetical protein
MATGSERPDAAWLRRQASRHSDGVADARRDLALYYQENVEHKNALEDVLDEIRLPWQRYRISRKWEVASLIALGAAETVVAETVVQSLGFTAIATDLVALGVGAAATGLAWLAGHEWAISRDPRAAAAGQRGWHRLAIGTAGAFLAANLGVRIYYGVLAEQVTRLGGGLIAPLLSGSLLTLLTAALMVVAAFISAHADTAKETQLRAELRRVRAIVRSLENRMGVLRSVPARNTARSLPDEGASPAA